MVIWLHLIVRLGGIGPAGRAPRAEGLQLDLQVDCTLHVQKCENMRANAVVARALAGA